MPKVLKDTKGRPYAQLSTLRAGNTIQVDAGFTCLRPHSVRRVLREGKGKQGLYIKCKSGKHFLCGQADDGENLIGIYNT